MVVAVAAVRVMQVTRNEIVRVVAVGDGRVPAVGAVNVSVRVARAVV
jgi:hypothetical protein